MYSNQGTYICLYRVYSDCCMASKFIVVVICETCPQTRANRVHIQSYTFDSLQLNTCESGMKTV